MSRITKSIVSLCVIIFIVIAGFLIYKGWKFDEARSTQPAPYGYMSESLAQSIYNDSVKYVDNNAKTEYNLQLAIKYQIRNNLEDFKLNDYNAYKFFVNNKAVTQADRDGTGFTIPISKVTGKSVDLYAHVEFLKTTKLL